MTLGSALSRSVFTPPRKPPVTHPDLETGTGKMTSKAFPRSQSGGLEKRKVEEAIVGSGGGIMLLRASMRR